MTAIGRALYAVFFVLGGFLFAIPKWILMGTKGGRQRAKIIKLQEQQLRQAGHAPTNYAPVAGQVQPPHYGEDTRLWWDGYKWVPTVAPGAAPPQFSPDHNWWWNGYTWDRVAR